MMSIAFRSTSVLLSFFKSFLYVLCAFLWFCVHDVFWCVLCVWAKLPEIKLDDDDDVTTINLYCQCWFSVLIQSLKN